MIASLFCIALGVLICVIGVRNMQGDISTLHYYHRSRVSEDNVKPMGRLVGLGTVVCGASVIIYSVLLFVTIKTNMNLFTIIGVPVLLIGMAVGLAITVFAMKKYNGGVF